MEKRAGRALFAGGYAVLAAALLFFAYQPSFSAGWHFDDYAHIVNNPSIKVERLSLSGIRRAFLDNPLKNRPLSYLSFALDYYRGGEGPRAFHETNLFIHFLNTLLAAWFFKLLLGSVPFRGRIKNPGFAAGLAGLWFGLNPVQTQSVTYVVQRMNLLASLFTLVSLCCWLRAREEGNRRFRVLLVAAACIAALFGFASKETGFSLFLYLPALDLVLYPGEVKDWLRARGKWLLLGLFVAAVLAGLYLRGGGFLEGYRFRDFTPGERLLSQPRAVLWYVSLWFFPSPRRLSIEHEFAVSTGPFTPWTTLPAIFVVAGGLIFALKNRKPAPQAAAGFLFYLAGMALESSVLPLEMVFEHRLYLPCLGLILMTTGLLSPLSKRGGGFALCLCVPLLLAVLSRERNRAWHDTRSLWRDAVRKAPAKSRAWSNLCAGEFYEERLNSAEKWCRVALARNPEEKDAWYNLGLVLYKQGRFREAEVALEKAASLGVHWAETYYQLGRARARQGKFQAAEEALMKAVSLDPEDPAFWYQLGITRLAAGKREQGKKALLEALRRAGPDEEKVKSDIKHALGLLAEQERASPARGP